jgi:hypothetical protein
MSPQNSPESPSQTGFEGILERVLGGLRRARRSLRGGLRERSLGLATMAAIVGAALLVLSRFLDVVRFVEANGGLIPGAEATRNGTSAMVVIGLAIALAALTARWADNSLPALAAAALGAVALAIVLIGDLPDVTSSGITRGKLIAEANPGPGFWVELAGALVAIAAGLALARLLALEHSARGYQR